MQMDIQSQGFVLTDGINNVFTQRLAFGLPTSTPFDAQANDH